MQAKGAYRKCPTPSKERESPSTSLGRPRIVLVLFEQDVGESLHSAANLFASFSQRKNVPSSSVNLMKAVVVLLIMFFMMNTSKVKPESTEMKVCDRHVSQYS